jgi:hypothetical protein
VGLREKMYYWERARIAKELIFDEDISWKADAEYAPDDKVSRCRRYSRRPNIKPADSPVADAGRFGRVFVVFGLRGLAGVRAQSQLTPSCPRYRRSQIRAKPKSCIS